MFCYSHVRTLIARNNVTVDNRAYVDIAFVTHNDPYNILILAHLMRNTLHIYIYTLIWVRISPEQLFCNLSLNVNTQQLVPWAQWRLRYEKSEILWEKRHMPAINKCPSNVRNHGVYFCFLAEVYSRLSEFRINNKIWWCNCFLELSQWT
jgi:hypothetical protein